MRRQILNDPGDGPVEDGQHLVAGTSPGVIPAGERLDSGLPHRGDDTVSRPGPDVVADWPWDSQSASYTASMARPVSAAPPCPEPARIRAPTRQAALTGPPAEAPAASPFRTVCRPPSDDHQPPWTHPADSSVRAASSRARSCSRQACWTSSGGGAARAGRRCHQGRGRCAGPPPVSTLVAGLLTAPVSGAGAERKIVAIPPASSQRAPERQRRRQSVDRCDFWDDSQFDRSTTKATG